MKIIIVNSPKYGVKEIPVDDADYEELNKYHWCVRKMPKTFYAIRSTCTNGKEGSVYIHRQIMNETDPKIQIDHKDHNGLNNQRNNLRKCNHSQNKQNQTGHGKSKYLGVTPIDRIIKREEKSGIKTYHCTGFQAQITINGKQTHLGTFKTEEEAARIRDEAAKKHHGEFANLNFK